MIFRNARPILLAAALAAVALTAPEGTHADNVPVAAETMHVTKTPTCGCCGAWVSLAREHGFAVEVTDTIDYAGMKHAAGVPEHLWACHTARLGGYVVEGHVPFAAIEKLLTEQPDIDGISVPGMPSGSPGMGSDAAAVYDVIAYGGAAGDGAVFHTAGRER